MCWSRPDADEKDDAGFVRRARGLRPVVAARGAIFSAQIRRPGRRAVHFLSPRYRAALREMQGEVACLAGDASCLGEEAASQGLVGRRGSPRAMRGVRAARL